MYINVENSGKGSNKGSCSALVNYLDKENEMRPITERELFFSHGESMVNSYRVQQHLDTNRKGVGKTDGKFFMITINPSGKEQQYLKGDKKKLKDYTREVMGAYARNFGKELTGDQLVYYAKLEENRYYKGTDPKVLEGSIRMNEVKPGDNMHVHVIVSRKDASNKIKLSPMTHHRNTTKGRVHGGFDRVNFKQRSEEIFDQMFSYERPYEDSFNYSNTIKNGTREQRQEAIEKRQIDEMKRTQQIQQELQVQQLEKQRQSDHKISRGRGL